MGQLNILNPTPAGGLPDIHDSSFIISPNQTSIFITISIPESLFGKTALVTDITGKQMATVQLVTVNQQLSTSNWANGIYFVLVGNAVKKLVVQK